jgi:hypothetical protein
MNIFAILFVFHLYYFYFLFASQPLLFRSFFLLCDGTASSSSHSWRRRTSCPHGVHHGGEERETELFGWGPRGSETSKGVGGKQAGGLKGKVGRRFVQAGGERRIRPKTDLWIFPIILSP